ncbi:MAG: tetratricopeptide repeat protein, partial [bacterium]
MPHDVREAAALLEAGRAAEAYALLEKSIEGEPNAARLVTFAEACERLGRFHRGVRAIEQARELAPDSHRALYVQALLDRDRQRPADALEAVRAAIALEPGRVEYHLL